MMLSQACTQHKQQTECELEDMPVQKYHYTKGANSFWPSYACSRHWHCCQGHVTRQPVRTYQPQQQHIRSEQRARQVLVCGVSLLVLPGA
eukprot:5165-Heterococcus_DN1.PRE.1